MHFTNFTKTKSGTFVIKDYTEDEPPLITCSPGDTRGVSRVTIPADPKGKKCVVSGYLFVNAWKYFR
jgi:hypothetical protein